MITFYGQLVYWSGTDAPMWKLIVENLACLNEECGEISLSMLASIQKPFQRGVIEQLIDNIRKCYSDFIQEESGKRPLDMYIKYIIITKSKLAK